MKTLCTKLSKSPPPQHTFPLPRRLSNVPENTVYGGQKPPKPYQRATLTTLCTKQKKGEPITMVTAYDFPSAVHLDSGGIDIALVGDSGWMVLHGHDTTLPIMVEEMLVHCQSVARGAKRPLLVGDLAFATYESSSRQYWRAAITSLLTCTQLVEYVVLDVDSVSSEDNVGGSKYVLADVEVARISDFGKNNTMFFVRTHLGHLLNPGDYALDYDLYYANSKNMELDKYKGLEIPEAILVKKNYKKKRLKKHENHRPWKPKSLYMEVDVSTIQEVERMKKRTTQNMKKFSRDLEENPELRFNVSLYQNKEYQRQEMVSVTDGEDLPSVSIEELLADLEINDEDVEDEGMAE